jgi:hypothetical protein
MLLLGIVLTIARSAILHRHCHDNKHFTTKGMYDKHRVIEEPYECESLMYGSEDESVW